MPYNTTTGVWEPETPGQQPPPGANPASLPGQNDSVARRVTGLLSEGSPLLQVARTDAAKTANRRGLLNSSIAAGAGTEAAIRTATPIASQDASQQFQKNISKQTFGQNRTLTQDQTDSAERISASSNANRIELGQMDVASREKIAGLNITSNDREKAIASSSLVNQVYTGALQTIMSNENLPKATRDAAIAQIEAQRDSQYGLIEQIYRIDLQWAGSSAASGVNPGPPAPSSPTTPAATPAATPGGSSGSSFPTNPAPVSTTPTAPTTTPPSSTSGFSESDNVAFNNLRINNIPIDIGGYMVSARSVGRNGTVLYGIQKPNGEHVTFTTSGGNLGGRAAALKWLQDNV